MSLKSTSSVYVNRQSTTTVSLNYCGRAADDFDLYAEAYHRAGQTLFDTNFKPEADSSLDVLPIAFLYRHAAELYLKAIVRKGNTLLSLRSKPLAPIRQVHSLRLLLEDVRPIFQFMNPSWETERQTFLRFVAALEQDDVLGIDDRSGDMWRYPVRKKDDTDHLPQDFTFDVREFVQRLDIFLAMLAGAAGRIDWAIDGTYEDFQYSEHEQLDYSDYEPYNAHDERDHDDSC